jgi:hypothetical protein
MPFGSKEDYKEYQGNYHRITEQSRGKSSTKGMTSPFNGE